MLLTHWQEAENHHWERKGEKGGAGQGLLQTPQGWAPWAEHGAQGRKNEGQSCSHVV